MSRIDEIKAYAQRRDEDEKKRLEKADREWNELYEKLPSFSCRIKELIETANACTLNGIEIAKHDKEKDSSYNDERKYGTFTTNGITHRLGFVNNNRMYSTVGEISEIGIECGGASGVWDFRTDGDKFYEKCNSQPVTRKPSTHLMERFINEFDEFEKDFYEYVDKITKGGK